MTVIQEDDLCNPSNKTCELCLFDGSISSYLIWVFYKVIVIYEDITNSVDVELNNNNKEVIQKKPFSYYIWFEIGITDFEFELNVPKFFFFCIICVL